ncbi:MAG: methionine--tRNA ligase [Candidatus Gastranaerophilales bacterium]|nr:methionine--tRNA ligase [Candidatus Gastranaerophilales bacterium]
MNKFYLTTAIDYVNGAPHIGHAYEKIMSDVIIRHQKQLLDDVYFLTGTDEHGIKIQKTAETRGITPKELCDENNQKFVDAWKELEIDYDKLIRTTDEDHREIVQKIFKKLLENGDIYKHSYTGLYCSGCESFLNARDLTEDGLCPDHQKKPEEVKEENYFFKLTKYKDRIIEHIKNNPTFLQPAFRANEVLNQLEDIEDISVSRAKSSVSWGIPVPGDDSQIIYVWIDALSNYITALGYDTENPSDRFKKYWPADVQVIGKDIIKFHSIYWIAILMALGIELPKTILGHGWITIDESKMSKSIGNVIAPHDVIEHFEMNNSDALRYYMMACAPFGKDGNYSDLDFKEKVNADLANNIGNLLNRTLNMLVKYFDGEIKPEFKTTEDSTIAVLAKNAVNTVNEYFEKHQVAEAADSIVDFSNAVNKYVTDNAPWGLAKEEKMQECANVLYNTLEAMHYIAVMIYPYCPNIAKDILQQLDLPVDFKLANLKWGDLKTGIITDKSKIKPVFLRLDSEFATDKKKGK